MKRCHVLMERNRSLDADHVVQAECCEPSGCWLNLHRDAQEVQAARAAAAEITARTNHQGSKLSGRFWA